MTAGPRRARTTGLALALVAITISAAAPFRAAQAQGAGFADAGVAPDTDPVVPGDAATAAEERTPSPADASPPAGDEDTESEAPDDETLEPAAEGTGEDGERQDLERIRYFLERIEVTGNTTSAAVIRHFVPLETGDVLDVEDPAIEAIRWQLLGTGWFEDVRLRLERGSRRGWVVLVIEVEERNTFVVQALALGVSQGIAVSSDKDVELLPYAGITLAETNLLGLGLYVSLSGLVSKRQQGVRARFADPTFLGSGQSITAGAFYSHGLEFFGAENEVIVSIRCPAADPGDLEPPECPEEVRARNAVVIYERLGASVGTGHDLGPAVRYTLDWEGELIQVLARPEAASELRGTDVEPIDFAIDDGTSILSSLQLGLVYDRRDDPALPTQGTLVRFRGDLSSRLLGSDYEFGRIQGSISHWIPLPVGHLRLSAYAGAVLGRAPFFYLFHASDLSDLIPSRVLEMNIDHRAPPDVFGTAVAEMRAEELAGRIDVEYGAPLFRERASGLRALELYVSAGLYGLADRRDLRVGIPGYTGFERAPIDATFDLGVRADTAIGVFQLGFSTVLGFVTP